MVRGGEGGDETLPEVMPNISIILIFCSLNFGHRMGKVLISIKWNLSGSNFTLKVSIRFDFLQLIRIIATDHLWLRTSSSSELVCCPQKLINIHRSCQFLITDWVFIHQRASKSSSSFQLTVTPSQETWQEGGPVCLQEQPGNININNSWTRELPSSTTTTESPSNCCPVPRSPPSPLPARLSLGGAEEQLRRGSD